MILDATDISWLDFYFRMERLLDLGTNISMSLETDSFVIFGKEKKMCCSELVKQDKYFSLFADVGHEKYLGESTLKDMYVCKNVCMFFIWIPPIGFSE